MGLYASFLKFIDDNIANNFESLTDLKMLELGNQHILFPNKHRTGKSYYTALGYHHVSVDVNGQDGAEVRDLTKLDQFTDFYNTFDVVTNSGTTEHVEPLDKQYECWNIIHNCLKTNGISIHLIPDIDELINNNAWPNHCPFYYSSDFFETLAKECNYELQANTVIMGLRCAVLKKTTSSNFVIPRQTLINKIAVR